MQKGPYFQPVQYISPVPEGYAQAGANIGRSIGGGLAALGAGVSEGIDKYYKSEEERQALGGTISRYFKSDPKLAETVDQKLLEKYTSGKATLADHKALFADISTEQMLQQKKLQTENARLQAETARLANERSQAELGYLKSKENDNKILREAMAMNTDTDGNLDFASALQTYSEMNGNIANNDILAGLKNVQNINFGTEPKIKTLTGESGQSVDVLQTGPGSATVIQREKPAATPMPQSELGKKQFDRDQALRSGNEKDAADIQKEIDAQVKKDAESNGAKPLTADQSNALNFSLRLIQNEDFINKNNYDATAFWNEEYKPERFASQDKKAYDAAKNNWIAAALRKESGAAIGPDEYNKYDKQYFPQGGDGKTVIEQKKLMRNQLMQGMTAGIGPNAADYLARLQVKPTPPPVVAPVTVKAPSGLNYTVTREPAKKR
jgi:hypothetical protein